MPTNTVYQYFARSTHQVQHWLYGTHSPPKSKEDPPSLAICDSAPLTNEHQWTKPVCSIPYKSSLKHQY